MPTQNMIKGRCRTCASRTMRFPKGPITYHLGWFRATIIGNNRPTTFFHNPTVVQMPWYRALWVWLTFWATYPYLRAVRGYRYRKTKSL